MNQYSIKQMMPRVEAEKLLRVALFSDSLQLEVVEDETRNLVKRRRKLAKTIRESRKKGVVPVFISMMWFLFSLVVSVQLGKSDFLHPACILCALRDEYQENMHKVTKAVRLSETELW